jgi:hypothetical protein
MMMVGDHAERHLSHFCTNIASRGFGASVSLVDACSFLVKCPLPSLVLGGDVVLNFDHTLEVVRSLLDHASTQDPQI